MPVHRSVRSATDRSHDIPAERRAAPGMEGAMARWYARNRGSANQLAQYRRQAAALAAQLPDGARVLEIAFGPGYLSVELARSGRLTVQGVDLSRTFVELATAYAAREHVAVDFRQGDAGDLPYPDAMFDLVVCQAAFKNFPRPVRALDEMYRVLRPGGLAVVHDMDRTATRERIRQEVAGMGIGRWDAAFTRLALRALRRRAADPEQFRRLAEASAFGGCTVTTEGIGLEVRLRRPAE